MRRTARRVHERLAQRGLQVEVRELPDSTRTAAEAVAAIGCEVGQIVKSLVFVSSGVGSTEPPNSAGAGSAGAGAGTAEPVIVLCAGDRQVDAGRLGLARADADAAREATGGLGGRRPGRDTRSSQAQRTDRVDSVGGARPGLGLSRTAAVLGAQTGPV